MSRPGSFFQKRRPKRDERPMTWEDFLQTHDGQHLLHLAKSVSHNNTQTEALTEMLMHSAYTHGGVLAREAGTKTMPPDVLVELAKRKGILPDDFVLDDPDKTASFKQEKPR